MTPCACPYTCMYGCLCVGVGVHMCLCVGVGVHMCLCVGVGVHMCLCVGVGVHMCLCVGVHMCLCVGVHMCLCVGVLTAILHLSKSTNEVCVLASTASINQMKSSPTNNKSDVCPQSQVNIQNDSPPPPK